MYRHKQGGAGLAGARKTLLQRNIVVTGSDQQRSDARLIFNQLVQLTGNGQRHILLVGARRTNCAWILAAMTRINGHDHVALATVGFCNVLLHLFVSRLVSFRVQVNNQSVAVLARRRQQKALGAHLLFQIEHDPQAARSEERRVGKERRSREVEERYKHETIEKRKKEQSVT